MSSSLRIAIVGAGIGGLAAAALLKRAGHDVHVYDQAPRFARVGAGIQMAPNAVKVLRLLGVEERLRRIAFQPDLALSREWDSGEITSELRLGREVESRFGAPYLFLHRADLHAMIASAVPRDVVHLDMKLTGLEQNGREVTLAFADGTRARADAAIGADGVHSFVREQLLGAEKPRYTGRVAYRTTFPAARLGDARPASVRTNERHCFFQLAVSPVWCQYRYASRAVPSERRDQYARILPSCRSGHPAGRQKRKGGDLCVPCKITCLQAWSQRALRSPLDRASRRHRRTTPTGRSG
jgi:2-polyprenyl-6-methoxyphenol hydroxylase-like FAD-dependent oxidoreductase